MELNRINTTRGRSPESTTRRAEGGEGKMIYPARDEVRSLT